MSAARAEELKEFIEAYPGVTKLPNDVIEMNRGGIRLKTAYEFYEKQQAFEKEKAAASAAKNELAILKQNQVAASKAPVTGTVGKAAPKTEEAEDPFLIGFSRD